METIMYSVNYKLVECHICEKVDNLGNVLRQLSIILRSQSSEENSSDQIQLILWRFHTKGWECCDQFW